MRFGEEKNSDSRDSNHNTLAQNNLQPDWRTASLYSLQKKKVDLGGKTDAIGSNKEHAAAAEQMAHKEQFAW